MEVPTEQTPCQPNTVFRMLLAQVRWPVSHLFPQRAHAVSKTTQTLEDEQNVENVKDLNKLVVKVNKRLNPFQCFGQ